MEPALKHSILIISLGLAGCMSGESQRAVVPGELPPITRDYRLKIAEWSRGYYVDPGSLRDAALSDPILTRDSTGRLLWLVCLDIDAGPNAGGRQIQAFGFAPGYASLPLSRSESSINRADCALRSLAWRPWRELQRELQAARLPTRYSAAAYR